MAGTFTLVALVMFLLLRKGKPGEETPGELPSGGSAKDPFPLKLGSSGTYVVRLQKHLNRLIENSNATGSGIWSDPFLIEDGIFGSKTEAEVRRYYSTNEVSRELFNSKNM